MDANIGLYPLPLALAVSRLASLLPRGAECHRHPHRQGRRFIRCPRAIGEVVIREIGSTVERQSASDTLGEFRFYDLPPGAYRATVSAPGSLGAASAVTVAVSVARKITVTLQPSSQKASITVRGQGASITTQPLDTTSAVHQGVVSARDLETIPLAHRSFANIAYLAPGTEPVEPSDPTKARITAVSSGGSSGLNDEHSVDGGDNSDDYIGGFLQNFSPDAIQEFAVRTAQEDADTGRTTAGSVVITTKRGTNDWHGDRAFYERAAALNARFPIDNPAPESEAAVLAPELRRHARRSHHEGQALVLLFVRVCSRARQHRLQPRQPDAVQCSGLARFGRADPRRYSIPVPPTFPSPSAITWATVRLDWSQSSRSQWFLRGASDRLHHAERPGAAGNAALDRRHLALQLLEPRAEQPIYLQPDLARLVHLRCQRPAPHRDRNEYLASRWRFPSAHFQHDLRI